MKKYKTALSIIFMFLGIILLLIPALPKWVGSVVVIVGIFFFFYSSYGILLFTRASKIFTTKTDSKNREKALQLFNKAYKAGIPDQYTIAAASLVLQCGDIEKGKEMIESTLNNPNLKIKEAALITLSMYYWITKDIDKAIELCLEAKDLGAKDQNLYINLTSYYLAKGSYKEFKEILVDCYKAKMVTNAVLDQEAACAIIEKKYEKAGNLLTTVFDPVKPTYQDPYIHFAMLYSHYGCFDKAKEILEEYLKNTALFSHTTLYKKEDIEKMIEVLNNPKLAPSFAYASDNTPLLFLNGILPSFKEGVVISNYDSLPNFKKEVKKEKEVIEDYSDPTLPSTDLTDEDEEWLKKHNHLS